MTSNNNPLPVVIPPHLVKRVNPIKDRILFLSPSVMAGEMDEYNKDDFESLMSSSIGIGGFSKVYKVRHKTTK